MAYVEMPTPSQRRTIVKRLIAATQLHLYLIQEYRECIVCVARRPTQQFVRIRIGSMLQTPQYPLCGHCHQRINKRRDGVKATARPIATLPSP